MKEELELVRQIRALKSGREELLSEREMIFLAGLRKKLELHISQNPARPVDASLHRQLWNYATQNAKSGRLHTEQACNKVKMGKFENFYYNIKESDPFVNLKNIGLFNNTYTSSAALAVIILAIGIGGIASASQASLPGDNLYPIKILSEELHSALTASPTAKAILETKFSAKRVEEIKKVVQKSGVESKNIDVALDRLQKNTAKAADIIDKEKQNGNDISALAKDIEERNNANQKILKQILKKPIEETDESSDKNEENKTKNEESGKKEATKPNSSLNTKKPEAKIETEKNGTAATGSPEIKTKTHTEKRDGESERENNEDND